MKIDVSKIDGYSEMSAEDKIKALEGFEYEDNSTQVANLKKTLDKATSEAAEWKRKHNDLLTEDQKKKQEEAEEVQSLREQVASLQREKLIGTYKASFLSMGYEEALADETAKAMAEGDTAKVFANQKAFLESHDKTIKQSLMGVATPPAGGSSNIDYQKMAQDAQAKGEFSQAAYYMRLSQSKGE